MTGRGRLFAAGVLVAAGSLTLSGCGGDSGTTPTPVRTVIAQGTFSVLDLASAILAGDPCGFTAFVPFTTSGTGFLDVTVQWQSPSNNIEIAVARGTCTCKQAANDDCDVVAQSDSPTAKPELLMVSNLAAGSYTLVIANLGERSDSGTYEIGLTR